MAVSLQVLIDTLSVSSYEERRKSIEKDGDLIEGREFNKKKGKRGGGEERR